MIHSVLIKYLLQWGKRDIFHDQISLGNIINQKIDFFTVGFLKLLKFNLLIMRYVNKYLYVCVYICVCVCVSIHSVSQPHLFSDHFL